MAEYYQKRADASLRPEPWEKSQTASVLAAIKWAFPICFRFPFGHLLPTRGNGVGHHI
jgi:hypothetical protein